MFRIWTHFTRDAIKDKIIFEFYDVFPSKLIINKIAKEKNIPIIEIQHGIVTKQNPIFLKYYDIERKYDCMPNYIFSFGKKLLQKNNMPIKSQNIIYIGNSFLNYKKNEYKSIKKDKKYILFILIILLTVLLGMFIGYLLSKHYNKINDNTIHQGDLLGIYQNENFTNYIENIKV